MTLIVTLACLAIQRLVPRQVDKPDWNWIRAYYEWLQRRLGKQRWWSGTAGVVLLLGSLVLVYLLLIVTLLQLAGIAFTFLFHLVVLWFYLESRPLDAQVQQIVIPEVLMGRYQAIFAVLFWYVLLGPLGVIVYSEARRLELQLKAEKQKEVYFNAGFLDKLSYFRSLLDWLPVRLLGLTFALVGQFRPAFQIWLQRFMTLNEEPVLVVDYGVSALNWESKTALSGSAAEIAEIEALTTRALVVWLTVMAVFTIGYWL